MTPYRVNAQDPAIANVLLLIQASFAYMDGVVDPPSSVHQMTLDNLRDTAGKAELWAIGRPPQCCAILTPKGDTLYIGKLATATGMRGQGLGRGMIGHAQIRATALGLTSLTLETRIELCANHAAFAAMDFIESARSCHKGFDRHTSITFTRPVPRDTVALKETTR